jgi:hypothetical protein
MSVRENTTSDRIKMFCDKMLDTFDSRDQEHGDSWQGRTGLVGLFCQIERKTDRLYEAVYKKLTSGKELGEINVSLDSALDLAVYSALMYISLQSKQHDQASNPVKEYVRLGK